MNKQKEISIILFKPLPNAGRFKLHIPFLMTAERKILKALNTSYTNLIIECCTKI